MNDNLKPGWLDRQFRNVTEDVRAWPAWMKREAGFTGEKYKVDDKQSLGETAFNAAIAKARWTDNGGHLDWEAAAQAVAKEVVLEVIAIVEKVAMDQLLSKKPGHEPVIVARDKICSVFGVKL